MDGRKFLSGLNRYLLRKLPDNQTNRSVLTTRSHRSSDNSRFEAIGDITQTPPFNRNEFGRLISEQGLQTPRSNVTLENRQVRDKSYYIGLLHRKGYEVRSEIQKLLQECKQMANDQSVYAACKATAQSKVCELQNLQEVLRNYNCLDDLLNRDIPLVEAKEEYEGLKSENASAAIELEEIFESVRNKSLLIHELEEDVTQEVHLSDILGSTTSTDRSREKLQSELSSSLSQQDSELASLLVEKANLEAACKRLGREDVMSLLKNLSEHEKKRDLLLSEQHEGDFQKRKKKHADLLNCIRRQVRDTRQGIDKAIEELEEATNSAFQNKRACKVMKLKNHERVIDIFLESYPSQKIYLQDEYKDLQREVVSLLSKMSFQLNFGTPETQVVKNNGNDEQQLKESMRKELLSLLAKESLEDKLLEEIENLKQELQKKKNEIAVLSNIEALKASADVKMQHLMSELSHVKKQRDYQRMILKVYEERCDALKEELRKCPVSAELNKLEKRWHMLENENFLLKECIADSKFKSDYFDLKSKVMEKLRYLNEGLRNTSCGSYCYGSNVL